MQAKAHWGGEQEHDVKDREDHGGQGGKRATTHGRKLLVRTAVGYSDRTDIIGYCADRHITQMDDVCAIGTSNPEGYEQVCSSNPLRGFSQVRSRRSLQPHPGQGEARLLLIARVGPDPNIREASIRVTSDG